MAFLAYCLGSHDLQGNMLYKLLVVPLISKASMIQLDLEYHDTYMFCTLDYLFCTLDYLFCTLDILIWNTMMHTCFVLNEQVE